MQIESGVINIFEVYNDSFHNNLRPCPDGSNPIQFPTDCTRRMIDIPITDPFDISPFKVPGYLSETLLLQDVYI